MKYVALITGGSRGIGLGIAHALVKEGYRVAINGVRPIQQVVETLNDLKADGGEVVYCQGDIANPDERKKIVEEIKNQKLLSNEEVGDIVIKSSTLHGVDVPENIIPNIIDEIPILSIAAAFAIGKTTIKNAAELRVKESDRLNAISNGLSKLKINHKMFNDGISIIGTKDEIECSEIIDSFDDHRIAMSFLCLGLISENPIKVEDTDTINSSFPFFFDKMNIWILYYI